MAFLFYCLACYLIAFAVHHRKRIVEYVRREASFPPEPIVRNRIPGSTKAFSYENRIAAMEYWISQGERFLSKEDLEERLGTYLSEAEVAEYRDMSRTRLLYLNALDDDPYGDFGYRGHHIKSEGAHRKKATKSLIEQLEAS